MSSSQGSDQGTAIADVEECRRRRRLLLKAGEAIEDDETARQKMRDARVYERGVIGTFSDPVGFDPDNVGDVKSYHSYPFVEEYNVIKPMGYFAFIGGPADDALVVCQRRRYPRCGSGRVVSNVGGSKERGRYR